MAAKSKRYLRRILLLKEGFETATVHVFLSECLISAQAGCAYFSTEF